MRLKHFVDFTWRHHLGSLDARLNDVPGACLVEREDREKQIFKVFIVRFLIEAQAFDEGISLSELVYYN